VPDRSRKFIIAENIQLAKLRGVLPELVDKAQREKLLDKDSHNAQLFMDRTKERDPAAHALLLEQQRTKRLAEQVQLLTRSNKPKDQPNRFAKDKAKAKAKTKWQPKPKDGSPLVDGAARPRPLYFKLCLLSFVSPDAKAWFIVIEATVQLYVSFQSSPRGSCL
jgi:hypothetical protein